MASIQNYSEYRQRLASRIEQLITPDLKKVLIFGDRFISLEEKWAAQDKKVVNLKNVKKDWADVSYSNPEFNLDLEKNSFDVLISYHALEKAIDPERLLLEMRKYLVNEGLFICIAYNVGHISSIINLMTEGWESKEDGALKEGNIRYFSYDSLQSLLKMCGFEHVGEDIYGFQEAPELTQKLVAFTKNPYLNALSFITRGKRVEAFPFIEGTYP